jgi:tRNA1Val (adenine37-N6)-methyltransferase
MKIHYASSLRPIKNTNKKMPFRFKQFEIDDSLCAMKIGTDAVLLGAWTNCSLAKQILDIGTGSGILALMMAQKSQGEITAIEIEENAFRQASLNFQKSKWSNRINLIQTSLQAFCIACPIKFDVIISNPPYFKNSLKPEHSNRLLARHDDALSLNELLKCSAILMHKQSTLNLIYPFELKEELLEEAQKNNFHLIRLCKVYPNANKKPKRVMMSFSLTSKELISETIIIELDKRHHYSDEYIRLTKDFYLKF